MSAGRASAVRRPIGRSGATRITALCLVAAFAVVACSSSGRPTAGSTTPSTPTTPGTNPTTPNGNGQTSTTGDRPSTLKVALSKGTSQTAAAQPTPIVDGTALDEAAIAKIFSRLPEWVAAAADSVPFNWPTQRVPVPRAGTTVDVAFPAHDSTPPVEVPSGPLEVLRKQPEGEVAIAPFVSITFNQPMVAVGTVSQVNASSVPATITPAIAGTWQWIGTRTLRFDASSDVIDRLPMATEYTVTIPAGTRSVGGGELADSVTWTFATPPVNVISFQPEGDSLALTPVFTAAFDQRVDPVAVLATIMLDADGTRPVRLATEAEVAADDAAKAAVANAPDGRVVAFRPVDPLPADTAVSVSVGPGTPSAEGPRTTTDPASYSGRTYGPLRVKSSDCGDSSRTCQPGSSMSVQFTNPLDSTLFDPSSITVDPKPAGMGIYQNGDQLQIVGGTTGSTMYRITLPAGLTDVHGQTLGKDQTIELTFGEAQPSIVPFEQPLVTLDPLSAKPVLSVFSTNHPTLRLRVFTVQPSDWPAFIGWLENRYNGNVQLSNPPAWPVAVDTTISTGGEQDHLTETVIDLTSALGGPHGHRVVMAESTEKYSSSNELFYANQPAVAWVQATSIGLDVVSDNDDLKVWATSLSDGAPLAGVSVSSIGGASPSTAVASTDADGLAAVAMNDQPAVLGTLGDDSALLQAGYYGGTWKSTPSFDETRWYVTDDRQIYRPGEKMSVKGWVRRLTSSTDAQLRLFGSGVTVRYTLHDPQGAELGSGTVPVNALGGFDLALDIPVEANLGYAGLELTLDGVSEVGSPSYTHQFQIEQFRTPEFQVTARTESAGPYVSAQPATVAVDATYFAGGPLAAAPVNWQVTTAPATYSPPGWDGFNFGAWTPWWIAGDVSYSQPCCGGQSGDTTVEQFSGTTDANGTNYLQIGPADPAAPRPDLPVTITASATVTDVNRQAWSSTTNLLVHPGQFYVGLRSTRAFVDKGTPLNIDVVATDIDGAAVAGKSLTVTAGRIEARYTNGTYADKVVDQQTCNVTSAADPVSCTFTTTVGGSYRIESSITDDQGGTSRTELDTWVTGGDSVPNRSVSQQTLTVVPDQREYEPGSTARVLVQSPIATGQGLVTITHNGIVGTQTFTVANGSAVVEVPIADTDIPNLDLSIEVVGTSPRTADDGTALAGGPPQPAYAVGSVTLAVSTATRQLTVTAVPRRTAVAPGDATTIDVTVVDHAGAPVEGAEFAIVVVDEAVLALTNYQLSDPLATFYSQLPSYLSTVYGRSSIVLAKPEVAQAPNGSDGDATADTTAATTSAAGADPRLGNNKNAAPTAADQSVAGASGAGSGQPGIDVRTNFNALALFQPTITTDAAGSAAVDVTLPDNLTRYRVMVVAVAGDDRFGKAESNLTARLPLMVRPSAPRFANFGDTFELPVVVQNQTDQPMDVDVALQTSNLNITGDTGKRVTVPANDRVEVRFPVSTVTTGTARFRVAAVSGDVADAATVDLPVYTPATSEAFATYGVVDEGATAQPILAPTDVIPQFGGLDVTTSSTSLQALTDAVIYLADYPYRSSDALASRIIAVASLRDVLSAFDAPGLPDAASLSSAVDADIAALVALQSGDGGFPYWDRYQESEPYNSVQSAQALLLAKRAGYTVAQSAIDQASQYLINIASHIPDTWSRESRDTVIAYALNVRMLNGDRDSGAAASLYRQSKAWLQLDAIAWLWPVIDDSNIDAAIDTLFNNRAVETAGAANFATNPSANDDSYLTLSSDRRTDGIVLDALITKRPKGDLIPKVVAGLLANQTEGRWDNIQENGFILLALKHYFDAYESQTPDFIARVWLGDRFAGEQQFTGRSTDRNRIAVPTADLIANGNATLTIDKQGTGRLYYRIAMRTAPADLNLQPLDRGFVVTRSYEGVDDPADVTRAADGTWQIKAGARVRVKLTMVAESQRAHVALTDPLPAGLEILNPDLATTESVPRTEPNFGDTGFGPVDTGFGPVDTVPLIDWFPYRVSWFDHQNLGDDRAEAFSSLLPAGTYDYTYVARATTPGAFVVPPARAEEVYAPETFGRAATDRVTIVP